MRLIVEDHVFIFDFPGVRLAEDPDLDRFRSHGLYSIQYATPPIETDGGKQRKYTAIIWLAL
jgi:hypothetical protein